MAYNAETIALMSSRLSGWRETSHHQWEAICPAHDDDQPSLSVSIGDNEKIVIHCHTGCSPATVLKSLGLTFSSLLPDAPTEPTSTLNFAETYEYCDESGTVLSRVGRLIKSDGSKDFKQQQPIAGGGWKNGVKGIRDVVYMLPEVLASDPSEPVFIVEGEKDVRNLMKRGYIATCNRGGASKNPNRPKWKRHHSEQLQGRHLVILPDNDTAGAKHAEAIVQQSQGLAASIRIVNLLDLPPKGDFSDWLGIPGTSKQQFDSLVASTPPLLASSAATTDQDTTSSDNPLDTDVDEADDDPNRLARVYLQSYWSDTGPQLRFWRDQFYRSNGRAYRTVHKSTIRSELARAIKIEFDRLHRDAEPDDNGNVPQAKKVTTALISNVISALAGEVFIDEDLEIPGWIDGRSSDPFDIISMENGLFSVSEYLADPDNYKIAPHDSAFFTTASLPFIFERSVECPRWMDLLAHNIEGDHDRIAILQEWFGYCLIPDTSQQKFIFLEGEGSNGKSVVCAALEAMLGSNNVSAVPLEIFDQRFALTPTLGKLANIVTEVGGIGRPAEGLLKAFVGGDRMNFDRKNQTPIEQNPTARLILAANNRPRFLDSSNGLWRRMILFPMRVKVDEDDPRRVFGMDKARWWQQSGELSAIFYWALEGLARLKRNGRFTRSGVCDVALDDYRTDANPAREYLTEALVVDEEGHEKTDSIYARYRKWCEENGYKALNSRNFGKEIVRTFPESQKARRGPKRERYWAHNGIKFNEEHDVNDGMF